MTNEQTSFAASLIQMKFSHFKRVFTSHPRAKLLETESALKRSSTRMGSRGPPSPMIVPMSSNYNLNVSQSAESADLNSLLSLAKKDLHKLKKEKKRLASQG